jgi:16S rRNA (guanine1207-N2)-methyltransferase
VLAGPFNLILCNPPFHQGFSVESALTDKFLNSTQRLLAKKGTAYFVVNAFIPLESKAERVFAKHPSATIAVVANNKQFKVIRITG